MASALECRGLRKEFPGVVALAGANLTLEAGQIHALLGENGAGKSTLMKVMAGLHRPDGGELWVDGHPVRFTRPADAQAAGIATIYQEFSLVPDLSIAECVFLGAEPTRLGLPDFTAMRARAKELLATLGLFVDPRTKVSELSVAEQQLVEIARALRTKAKVLSMDEPTAALSAREAERLFTIVRRLKAEGVAILYVSHRLQEVFALCDVATVLRDGATVGHVVLRDVREQDVVKLMVGREVSELFPRGARQLGEVRLSVRGLTATGGTVPRGRAPGSVEPNPHEPGPSAARETPHPGPLPKGRGGRFVDVGFEVRAGEIVGLAGLVGAGRTEVLRGIFGADPVSAGEVLVDGQRVARGDAGAAVRAGLGLLPEDRKQQGLALGRSIRENTSLATLERFATAGVIDARAERQATDAQLAKVQVRMSGPEAEAGTLSGGNQQKVLLARWLLRGCKVLLFDEPTRGIDVGARAEIYEQIHTLAQAGLAIVVVSSELPEVIGLCDRVLVMAEGRVTGEVSRADATEERILSLATPRDAHV